MNILDNDINPMTWWGFGYVLKLHNLSQKSKSNVKVREIRGNKYGD
jgi:hypothetical protein